MQNRHFKPLTSVRENFLSFVLFGIDMSQYTFPSPGIQYKWDLKCGPKTLDILYAIWLCGSIGPEKPTIWVRFDLDLHTIRWNTATTMLDRWMLMASIFKTWHAPTDHNVCVEEVPVKATAHQNCVLEFWKQWSPVWYLRFVIMGEELTDVSVFAPTHLSLMSPINLDLPILYIFIFVR